jgi:hypothetical protein
MLPRLRLFVKKRGNRRTSTPWQGKVAEGLLFVGLIAIGAYGLYWLVEHVRSAVDAGWWPWFAMVIPAALIVFGSVELVQLLWHSSASSERRAAVVQKATDWDLPGAEVRPNRSALPTVPAIGTVTDSPGVRLSYRLPVDSSTGWVSFTMAAVCLIWLVAMFTVQAVSVDEEGRLNLLLIGLMVPFILAGLWTFYALILQVLQGIAIGPTRVEVSQHPFYPGGTFHAFVSQSGRLSVRWLQIQLVCEEHAVYQQGTDTRRAVERVYRAVLYTQRKFEIRPQQAFEVTLDLPIPSLAMHSFVSPHNAVHWSIIVRGRMARWGDFERRFPIYVYPFRAKDANRVAPTLTGVRAP